MKIYDLKFSGVKKCSSDNKKPDCDMHLLLDIWQQLWQSLLPKSRLLSGTYQSALCSAIAGFWVKRFGPCFAGHSWQLALGIDGYSNQKSPGVS